MYHEYFGLQEPAFSIAVNPKYLFLSRQHKESIAHLLYGIQGGGFVLLSGEVGTGKTTVIRSLLNQLPENTDIAFILNPMANVQEMIEAICEEFRIVKAGEGLNLKQLMDGLQLHLLENHAKGQRSVLLIDEAQLLSVDVLEQIRLLTNLETETEKLLQIVLVGQPEVNELLAQPRLRQLSQRITARFHLQALSLAETRFYIEHRLKVAGKKSGEKIFPDAIIKKIYKFSGGIPRLINVICERLLVGAYAHNQFVVDSKVFKLALSEVENTKSIDKKRTGRMSLSWPIMASTTFILAAAVLFQLSTGAPQEVDDDKLPLQAGTSVHNVDTQISAPAPAPAPKQDNEKLDSLYQGYTALFQYYDLEVNEESHPCWQSDSHNYTCVKEEFSTWREIADLNRPAILQLVTSAKDNAYALLIGVEKDEVALLSKQGTISIVTSKELGESWTGTAYYLWRKPPEFDKPIALGARSPVVTWVAEQFALIDGQHQSITQSEFTRRLQTRIKIFQIRNNLEADGIIGKNTLMKLNEKLGLSQTLIEDFSVLPAELVDHVPNT